MKIIENKVKSAWQNLVLGDDNIVRYMVISVYKSGRTSPENMTITTSIVLEANARTTYPWFSVQFENEKNAPANTYNCDFSTNFQKDGIWSL